MAWRPVTQGLRNGYKDGYDDGYYNKPIRHTVYGLNDSYDPDRVPRSDADADGYAMPLDVSGIASPRPPYPAPASGFTASVRTKLLLCSSLPDNNKIASVPIVTISKPAIAHE